MYAELHGLLQHDLDCVQVLLKLVTQHQRQVTKGGKDLCTAV
jgi:hypothetical protein